MQSWKESGVSELYSKGMLKYPHSVAKFVLDRLRDVNPNKTDKKFNTILDVGCGVGGSLERYLPYFHSAIGIDISRQQIEKAKSINNSENTSFVLASEDSFPVESHSVDLIICASSAHYMKMDNFVSESKRVLKEGGLVAIYAHGFSDLTVQRVESSGSSITVSGYEIMMKKFVDPTHQHLLDSGHPASDWIKRYEGIYNQIPCMKKERWDDMALEYPLTLKELKDYFLSSPAYKNFHDSFSSDVAPMNIMAVDLKNLGNCSDCDDAELRLCLTLSLFFVFLS